MDVCERWLLEKIQSEMKGDRVGIWHLGKLVNLRLTKECIPWKAENISGVEQVGQTKEKIACVSYSSKEKAADGGLKTSSERDSKTGRELIQTNLEK